MYNDEWDEEEEVTPKPEIVDDPASEVTRDNVLAVISNNQMSYGEL